MTRPPADRRSRVLPRRTTPRGGRREADYPTPDELLGEEDLATLWELLDPIADALARAATPRPSPTR